MRSQPSGTVPDPSLPDPRLTVVVITRNRREELLRTLGLLAALPERPPVIVVDNGSADGTAAAVRRAHPQVHVIAARRNLGAVGRNLAVRRVTTPYVAFCDDDTWWEPGSLALAADALDRHPDLASVTARIVVKPAGTDDPIVPELAQSPVPARPGLPGPALMSILAGASMLRCDAFREVGGFSPRLVLGGEEELLAADLAARGWVLCYLPRRHAAPPGLRPARPDPAPLARDPEHAVVHLAAASTGGGAAPDRGARGLRAAGQRVGQRLLGRSWRPALGPARTPATAAVRGSLDPAARRAAPPLRGPALRRLRRPPGQAATASRALTRSATAGESSSRAPSSRAGGSTGMDGAEHRALPLANGGVLQAAAVVAHVEPAAEEGLPGHRSSCGDPGPDRRQPRFRPAAAGHDLGPVGSLMDAAFAAGLPFEVLHRVRDVGVGPLDAALAQGAIQEVAGRADERVALLVLLVPGLLADQGQERVRAALAEHGRGRPLVQVTACTGCGFLSQFLKRGHVCR